jgi:hypothetical protein
MSRLFTVTVDDSIITLVGRATALGGFPWARFYSSRQDGPPDDQPVFTWKILVWDPDSTRYCSINLQTRDPLILEQLRRVSEGCPIRVVAELPTSLPPSAKLLAEGSHGNGTLATWEIRLDSPDVKLTATRLELLGWPVDTEVAA